MKAPKNDSRRGKRFEGWFGWSQNGNTPDKKSVCCRFFSFEVDTVVFLIRPWNLCLLETDRVAISSERAAEGPS